MENFDFNVPIDATVIFDDSDDETKPNINDLQIEKDETKSITSINNAVTRSRAETKSKTETKSKAETKIVVETKTQETTLLKNRSFSQVTTVDKSISDIIKIKFSHHSSKTAENSTPVETFLDMPSLEEVNLNIDVSASDTNNNKTTAEQEIVQPKSKKRKTCLSEKHEPKQNLRADSKGLNEDTNKIERRSENIQINANCTPNGHPPNIDISPQPTQTDVNQTVTNYLREILNTVSEHMISIINSYQSYHRINKSNSRDRGLIEMAKNNFICTKNHFFDLSYSSIVNIIVPKLKDNGFITNFINYTIKLARSKSYPYSYHHMEPLFYEMIDWAKNKQKDIEIRNINKVTNPLLTQELSKPVQYYNNPPPAYPSEFQQEPTVSITKQGVYAPTPPERVLSMDPSHSFAQNELRPSRCPVIVSPQSTCGYLDTQMHNEMLRQSHSLSANAPINNLQAYVGNMGPTPSQNQAPPSWETQSIPVWQQQDTAAWQKQATPPAWQKQATPPAWQKQPIPPPWQKQATPPAWQKQATLPACQKQSTQSQQKQRAQSQKKQTTLEWPTQAITTNVEKQSTHAYQKQTKQPLPSISMEIRQNTSTPIYTSEIDNLIGYSQYFRQESPSQAEPNRSISRDSGFMSPLDFNSSTDQLLIQEEQITTPAPLITHVTSLNPNVSYIVDGLCIVCGKTTRKKCLGCFKCYYCSHSCQITDWHNHMVICKKEDK